MARGYGLDRAEGRENRCGLSTCSDIPRHLFGSDHPGQGNLCAALTMAAVAGL